MNIGTSVDGDRRARLESDGGSVKRTSPQFSRSSGSQIRGSL